MRKMQFRWFAAFAFGASLVLSCVSYTYAASCTVSAQVCDFTIIPNQLKCVNGVGSQSIMGGEAGRTHIPTDLACGFEWAKVWYGWVPTGQHCGTYVSTDCT